MENYINNLDLVLGDVDITLDENAIEPERQYAFDGGADLFSPIDCTIEPKKTPKKTTDDCYTPPRDI